MGNSYHTSIKLSCKMNMLPESIARQIPRSTLHRFRNTDYSYIFGIELAAGLEQNELLIKELLQCKTALAVSRGIIRIKNTLIKIREQGVSELQRMKEVVSAINDVKDSTGIDTALEYFGISRSTYHSWQFQVKHHCYESYTGKCLRRWPNQVPVSAVEKIKALCEDEEFKGWPVVSIAHYARRKGLLDISVHTWYKYAKLLGISAKPPRCLKKKKPASVLLCRTSSGMLTLQYSAPWTM